ncbi:hypothetical protein CVT24_005092 [Panaeolus cyanescens]|uniref:Uncharacterized protein n=1 Tax=Panaeolus cyanescens TaxID=181874 RepID=A0A409W275_9AGAR|nr:hypothetical protein CVT24_005092 [Panaeolus cyanescens]
MTASGDEFEYTVGEEVVLGRDEILPGTAGFAVQGTVGTVIESRQSSDSPLYDIAVVVEGQSFRILGVPEECILKKSEVPEKYYK